MKLAPQCIYCILRQCVEAAKLATDNGETIWAATHEVLEELRKATPQLTPAQVSKEAHRAVREITRNPDPYKKVKDEFNRLAKKIYPRLKEIVKSSENRLDAALKLSIAGNIIDFAIGEPIDVEETIEQALRAELAIDDRPEFRDNLKGSKEILFIADNAGEVFFDKLLMGELGNRNITYAVKSAPILNDATIEDARFAGLDKLSKVITTGVQSVGIILEQSSQEFKRALHSADMIIAKGHGNYETLEETDYNIFFLLKAKCKVIAKSLKVKVGDLVLKRNKII